MVAPEWLEVDWLLAAFGEQKGTAFELYQQFISEGKNQPSPWQQLKNQIFLGDDHFVAQHIALLDVDKSLSEIPRSQRRGMPKTLAEYEGAYANRNAAIHAAYQSGGYSMKDIGDFFNLHYSRVSRIVERERKVNDKA
ncbi:hypothetical protein [Shewanella baltica]|uniref:hypothetical protein n=1 Tax=Shewanella baltica TaxID=62322 RepID=UPI00217E88CD|nr:hypothetical protein [Shewanella baltica]